MIQPDSREDAADTTVLSPEVVTFPVEVDITCSETLGQSLLAAFRPGASVVIADLSRTQFCDSSAIRHLILASNRAASSSAELRIVINSPVVLRVLHVLEADQLLHLYPDMTSALAGA